MRASRRSTTYWERGRRPDHSPRLGAPKLFAPRLASKLDMVKRRWQTVPTRGQVVSLPEVLSIARDSGIGPKPQRVEVNGRTIVSYTRTRPSRSRCMGEPSRRWDSRRSGAPSERRHVRVRDDKERTGRHLRRGATHRLLELGPVSRGLVAETRTVDTPSRTLARNSPTRGGFLPIFVAPHRGVNRHRRVGIPVNDARARWVFGSRSS